MKKINDPLKKWANELNRTSSKELLQMSKNHILAIREMQIKTTLRFHLTPVRIAIIKNTTNDTCWQGRGKRNLHTLLVGMQANATTLENSMEAPQKTKNRSAI
jgi:hypothetical protein